MARLFVNGQWYYGLNSTAHYESEFELLVLQHARHLFTGWTAVPFKIDVQGAGGVRRPDFALIASDYSTWLIGEVELAHHSLEGHVLPQVYNFSTADFTSSHADYIGRQNADLDVEKLREMMLGEHPQTLVVVDRAAPDWARVLAPFGCLVCVVEVFRSERNEVCLRINGQQPRAPSPVVSSLRRVAVLPRTMVVLSPAALGGSSGTRFEIDFNGTLTNWVRTDIGDQVFLRAQKFDPLLGWAKVDIVRLADSRLAFRGERND